MKKYLVVGMVVAMTGITSQVFAQTAEKSSGVLKLNMSKEKAPEKVPEKTPEKTRANEYSQSTNIRMTKKVPVKEGIEEGGFSWISPAFTSVRTSEGSYRINATVSSAENIRFINIFVKGEFLKNIIPSLPSTKQMEIDEEMGLALGANQVKVEAVTVSGKKHESSLEIVYDISSATYYALVIAVQDYDDLNINDLDHPIKDAGKFIDIIQSDYNFKKENIQFMKNPTKADIIGTLHKMRSQVTPDSKRCHSYQSCGLAAKHRPDQLPECFKNQAYFAYCRCLFQRGDL
jgi:hypothetical protein